MLVRAPKEALFSDVLEQTVLVRGRRCLSQPTRSNFSLSIHPRALLMVQVTPLVPLQSIPGIFLSSDAVRIFHT